MNFKTTVVLIGLLAVVLGIALIVKYTGDEGGPKTDASGERKLFELEPKDATRLTIVPAEGQKMVLEKSGSDWRLVEPVAAPAETWEADSLVRSLLELRSRGQIEGSASPASLGLDNPRYKVEIAGKGGAVVKFNVGSRSAIGDNMYVQVEGQKRTIVVSSEAYEKLEKPAIKYRQSKLVTASSSDIRQIEVTRADGRLTLRKSGEDWQITEPAKMPGESSEVSDLTWGITGLSAVEFVTEGDVPSELLPGSSPKTIVWFSTEAPATQPSATAPATRPAGTTIKFGGFDTILKKNVYVSVTDPKGQTVLAKVTASSMDKFTKKPLELRDRKVLDVDPEKVSKLTVAVDLAATTQPTTRPASRKQVTIERRKESLVLGPAMPAPATTTTTGPATTQAAATQPASTQPLSKWVIASAGKTPAPEADESKVSAVLNRLHPLKADKYLEKSPTTKPSGRYTVTVVTDEAGGAKTTVYEVSFLDPDGEGKAIGQHKDLAFEADRAILKDLEADFAK